VCGAGQNLANSHRFALAAGAALDQLSGGAIGSGALTGIRRASWIASLVGDPRSCLIRQVLWDFVLFLISGEGIGATGGELFIFSPGAHLGLAHHLDNTRRVSTDFCCAL